MNFVIDFLRCILAWRIPWTEEPGGLLSMGLHRVGHDWSNLACVHALEKEMATHSSVFAWRVPGIEEPGGLLAVYGVTHSQTWLKRLSSRSRNSIISENRDSFLSNYYASDWSVLCNRTDNTLSSSGDGRPCLPPHHNGTVSLFFPLRI